VVQSVALAGGGTRSYQYDASGNLVGDNASFSAAYDHMHLAVRLQRGTTVNRFAYGPDGAKARQWGTDGTRIYLPGYEDVLGTAETKVYLGGYAVVTNGPTGRTLNYLLTGKRPATPPSISLRRDRISCASSKEQADGGVEQAGSLGGAYGVVVAQRRESPGVVRQARDQRAHVRLLATPAAGFSGTAQAQGAHVAGADRRGGGHRGGAAGTGVAQRRSVACAEWQ
jgi:hypothetical protein